jgi:hypothetical protein
MGNLFVKTIKDITKVFKKYNYPIEENDFFSEIVGIAQDNYIKGFKAGLDEGMITQNLPEGEYI